MKYIIMILALVTSSCGSVPLFSSSDGRNIGQPYSGYSTGDMGELLEGILDELLTEEEINPVTGRFYDGHQNL